MSAVPEELFENSLFFKGLQKEEIDVFLKSFSEKYFSAGTTVFIENMPGERLYLLVHGRIRISRMLAEGDERTLADLGPGDLFGEMAVIEGASRAATARVTEDARLLSLSREDFELFCEKFEHLGLIVMKNIMRTFSLRLRQNSDEYREMMLFALGAVE